MDSGNLYQRAWDLCHEAWPKFLFTPLIMVEWLLSHSKLKWKDLILDHSFTNYEAIKLAIETAKEEDLRPLWDNFTGLCTSWAINIAIELQKNNDIAFIYGNKAGHRVAWEQGGLTLDSTARVPLDLGDGKVKRNGRTKWMMRYPHTPNALLCSGPSESMAPFQPLKDHTEAMRLCLLQILQPDTEDELSFFSMYRKIEGSDLRFNGSFVWKFHPNETIISVSEVTVLENGAKKKERISAIFRQDNTISKDEEAEQGILMVAFKDFHSKKGRESQFGLVSKVFMEIWDTCIDVYGDPKYQLKVE